MLLKQMLIFLLLFYSYSGLSQAKSRLDSLRTSLVEETNDSLKVIYGLKLSRELHRKAHDEEEEYAYAQKAIENALQLNDTLLYARALDNFGLLYRYHQYYGEAMTLHIKAFKLVENKNVPSIYKMIFANNAGVAGRYYQKYDTAISYYMKALKIAERENDLKDIAISSNGIGNALGNIPGREDDALQYFKRALETEKKRDNSLGLAMNYLSISDYYINKKEYKTARDYLNKLLRLNQKRNDSYGLAITSEFFGISYLREGKNLEKAASYFKNALRRFTSLNDTHKRTEILISLGDVQLERNQFDAAEGYYRKSLALAEKRNLHNLIKENALRLSEVLEKEDRPNQALKFFKQGKAYEDSIKLNEQTVKITALTRKYDLEKKENRITLLQKDKDLQQKVLGNQKQELERRRLIMVLMGGGLLLLIIIFLLQYRNYRTKKKNNARIQQEEKAKMNAIYERNLARSEILVTRLRINPHFLFNSLNAITYLIQSEQNAIAIKYLVVFSRYTRIVLETSKKHVVPLHEELKLAEYYLTLEENRFKENFTYTITGADEKKTEGIFIPPLLLQPFIENAIWHGLLPSKRDKKTLHISIISGEDGTQIVIDDNGVGRKNPKKQNTQKEHNSLGLQIIEERIKLYNQSYTEKINYEIIDKKNENGQPQGTKVVLNISQRPAA